MAMNFFELELHSDPSTPQHMLPKHLRSGDNSREELCRKIALRLAQDQLSQKQKQALHMRYDLRMSLRELSSELGISRTAAEKRIKRSIDTLKTMVELCVLVQKELNTRDQA